MRVRPGGAHNVAEPPEVCGSAERDAAAAPRAMCLARYPRRRRARRRSRRRPRVDQRERHVERIRGERAPLRRMRASRSRTLALRREIAQRRSRRSPMTFSVVSMPGQKTPPTPPARRRSGYTKTRSTTLPDNLAIQVELQIARARGFAPAPCTWASIGPDDVPDLRPDLPGLPSAPDAWPDRESARTRRCKGWRARAPTRARSERHSRGRC